MSKKLRYIFPIVAVVLVASAYLMKFQKLNKRTFVESNEGPFWHSGTAVVGTVQTDSGKLFLATREQGITSWNDLRGEWIPWKENNKIKLNGSVVQLTSINDKNYLTTTDGSIFQISNDFNTFKKIITENRYPIFTVLECGTRIIAVSHKQIHYIDENQIIPFNTTIENRISAAACHDDQIVVGTEGGGLYKCLVSSSDCKKFETPMPGNHIKTLIYLTDRQSWLAALYGDIRFGVMEYRNGSWHSVGDRFGDILQFISVEGHEYPYALADDGRLYSYAKNNWRPITNQYAFTPPLIQLGNKNFIGSSGSNLVELNDKGQVVRELDLPIAIDSADILTKRMGNTFIYDIELVSFENGLVIFTATAQTGVWWSSDFGRNWTKLGDGLNDNKVHFVKYDSIGHKILAGTHEGGLFVCDFPCTQWRKVKDNRLTNADLQDAAYQFPQQYIIASERGAFVFDAKSEKIIRHHKLIPKNYSTESDLWTIRIINNRKLFGVYAEPTSASGVWELLDDHFVPIFPINRPITAILKHNDGLIVGTLSGLFFCRDSTIQKLNDVSINRISEGKKYYWLSSQDGIFRVPKLNINSEPEFISEIPSQISRLYFDDSQHLIVGSLQQGIVVMGIDYD